MKLTLVRHMRILDRMRCTVKDCSKGQWFVRVKFILIGAEKQIVMGSHGDRIMTRRWSIDIIDGNPIRLGIVGESNGSKPRDVLFSTEAELLNYIEHLRGNNAV